MLKKINMMTNNKRISEISDKKKPDRRKTPLKTIKEMTNNVKIPTNLGNFCR
jgi:hypothetical protein